MIYERVCYMCPKCNQMYFFNVKEIPSIFCPQCNIEMKNIGSEFVDSEVEKEKSEKLQKKFKQTIDNPVSIVYCPYCKSANTSKISTTSKVINTAVFGIFGTKRYKQWHCNQCNSDF